MPRDEHLAELEAHYQRDNEVDGITFVGLEGFGELRYGSGADNALFTGFYLAAASFRYSCEPTLANLQRVRDALSGIELLTTVTGEPGVLTRLAFPLEGAWERIGYSPANKDPSNTWTRRRMDGYLFESASHMYVTRTSRDQLTGIVFGLAAAWNVTKNSIQVDEIIQVTNAVKRITRALTARLEQTRYSLRDHTGSTHGTSAHRVLGPLKHALRLLDQRVNGTPLRGSLRFLYRWTWLSTFYYRFTRSTFAFNLRLTTGLTLWLLGEKDARRWIKRSYSFVRRDGNAWFVGIAEAVGVDTTSWEQRAAKYNFKAAARQNYGGWFRWQKPPGDWRGAPDRVGPSLDVLLPAWLARWSERERSA